MGSESLKQRKVVSGFQGFTIHCGKILIGLWNSIIESCLLLWKSIIASLHPERAPYVSFVNQISRQILYTGVEALWLVGIIAFVCGSTIVLQAMANMPRFGVSEYFGNILIIAVVRELGPFFTSLAITARSGAALASHIGSMKVNKEISALEVMGINPVQFLVVPALVGIVVSMICLSLYFDIIAIVGGLLIAKFTVQMPLGIFLSKVIEALTFTDIMISFTKGIVFGIVIAIVSCRNGLAVKNIRGVPKATIDAVVGSMAVTMIINIFVTAGFYVN